MSDLSGVLAQGNYLRWKEQTMIETRTSRKSGQDWTDQDVEQLRELAGGNTPVGVMSIRLGRSEGAIRSKAQAEGISLSPPNRSLYGDMS